MIKPNNYVKQLGFIPPPYGGVSVHVKRLTEQLNRDGYNSGAYYLNENSNTLINYNLYHKFRWLNTSKFIFRFIKLIEETRSFKIVHSHFSLEGMIFLWGLSVFCNKKIVVTVHNAWSINYYLNTNFINRFFLKRIVKRDITWIAVSEQAKSSMVKLPVKFNDIKVIPAYIREYSNFVDYKVLDENLILFLKKDSKVIVFYGHNFVTNDGEDVYGFNSVIQMFDLLQQKTQQNISLVMCIGENNQREISNLRRVAEEKKLANNIYWQIGPIKEMNALWKHTDVYVRPTSSDGDSVAVREALSLGIKVVASDVCNRPEGTIIYSYKDIIDFTNKVYIALNSEKSSGSNVDFYNQILSVYQSYYEH